MLHEHTGARPFVPEPIAAGAIVRLALLVPEVPLLAVLLCAFLALGREPLVGLLAVAVALGFGVRGAAIFLARRALAAALYRDADALAGVARALHPWSADALALGGAAALAAGRADEAARLLARANALLPGRAPVLAAHSGALLCLGQAGDAGAAARAALTQDAGCAPAYLHLAQAEHQAGAPPMVVEDRLRMGLRSAQDAETEATIGLALAWHLVGQERHAEARLATAAVEAAVARCSLHHQRRLRVLLCELLVAQGQTERAREHLSGVGP